MCSAAIIIQGVPKKAQSLLHRYFTIVSHSHAVFTKVFRNYLIAQKGQSMYDAVILFSAWKVNYSKTSIPTTFFNAIHDKSSLQQAQIAELMETMFIVSTV